jgi:dienelactone hydrolase
MTVAQSILFGQSFERCKEYFLARKGMASTMHLTPVGEDEGTKTFDFSLKTSMNDSTTGRIRVPKGPGPYRTALLTVGIETGGEAIRLIEGHHDIVFMAMDYPFEGSWNFSGLEAFGTTARLRAMAARTVPLLLHCLDWLFAQPFVDTMEVNVIAVSFGSFTGIPAAVIDSRVKQLVVVQGGGNLSTIIAHNAKRWGAKVPGALAGWLGGILLSPFEPTRYIGHLAPRPLLMINGQGDTFFPRSSAEALLSAAQEPKEIIWHRSAHVMPDEQDLVNELTREIAIRLYGEE